MSSNPSAMNISLSADTTWFRGCASVRTRRNLTSGTELGGMSAPTGVPLRLSSFIGRKREMGELRRLLAHTRLLTMLGPGGAGKTRLATEFARAQGHRFADGQITIELVE